MNTYQVYAIAAPLNAFICCAFISLFIKSLHLKTSIRVVVTYIVYVLLTFVTCAGGEGLFNINMENFLLTKFVLFSIAGACVCAGLYVYFEKSNISDKIRRRQAEKAKSKK